ncbi:MAG: S8 family serine peptidase [Geminicoccaceae bacterium]
MALKSDTLQKSLQLLLAGTAMITLSACGGGGGGGDGGGGGGAAGNFRNQDFNNSTGLDQIRAAEGFAQITGALDGAGTTIAILDDGIDEDHPDLQSNGTRTVTSLLFGNSQDVDSQHGTAVAGIAAGGNGNGGIRGVAADANILAFQVGDQNPNDPTEITFDNAAIAAAIRDASRRNADIINMSLGVPVSGFLIESDGSLVASQRTAQAVISNQGIADAILDATSSGSLVVIAAGNSRDNLGGSGAVDITPDMPAFLGVNNVDLQAGQITRAASADGVIVAIAVDSNNQRASFSNSCRGVEDRCLAAPGVNFQGALPGGGIGNIGSGTSYAAPLISGAAAVVQAAFDVTAQQAGNRLLSTATDLGAPGADADTGVGLLNLENALSPQGQLTVALTASSDGSKVLLSGTTLSLGSSLALDGAGSALLGKAVSLDDDNFPFGVDLGRSAAVQSRTTGLEAFIGSSNRRTTSVADETWGYSLSLAEDQERDDPYRAEFAASDTALREEAALPRMQMQSELRDGVDLFFGFNGSSNTDAGLVQSLPETGDFFQPTAFLAPFDQLSGEQTGGGTTVELSDDTDLTVSAFASTDDDAGRQTTLQKVELAHKTIGDIELRLGYGFMQEEGGYLGSEAKGAFGAESGGNSQYLDLSVLAPLSEKISLFGAYSRGNTDASGGTNSLLSDYSTIHSEAFGAGLVVADLVDEGDGLSLMVGQPLRVTDGSAELTVPTERNQDGTLVQERATLDLSPEGREIAIETVYNFALDDENQALTAGSFVRFNPDHDSDADPDVGIGLTYKLKF